RKFAFVFTCCCPPIQNVNSISIDPNEPGVVDAFVKKLAKVPWIFVWVSRSPVRCNQKAPTIECVEKELRIMEKKQVAIKEQCFISSKINENVLQEDRFHRPAESTNIGVEVLTFEF